MHPYYSDNSKRTRTINGRKCACFYYKFCSAGHFRVLPALQDEKSVLTHVVVRRSFLRWRFMLKEKLHRRTPGKSSNCSANRTNSTATARSSEVGVYFQLTIVELEEDETNMLEHEEERQVFLLLIKEKKCQFANLSQNVHRCFHQTVRSKQASIENLSLRCLTEEWSLPDSTAIEIHMSPTCTKTCAASFHQFIKYHF